MHRAGGLWLGAGVVVLPNERLGKGAVISAGSVMTRVAEHYGVSETMITVAGLREVLIDKAIAALGDRSHSAVAAQK